jgi:hypothetical protein
MDPRVNQDSGEEKDLVPLLETKHDSLINQFCGLVRALTEVLQLLLG